VNTDLVSRTGMVPEQITPPSSSPSPTEVLEAAVDRVLVAVGPSSPADPPAGSRHAEESLRAALRRTDTGTDRALAQAVACAEAACEHLRYSELQEARLLLVAARGQLVRSHTGRT
jgi:hypothetical protein